MIHRENIDPWTTVLTPAGDSSEEECLRLAAMLETLESKGRARVLIDLSRVGSLDQWMILILLRRARKAVWLGGGIKFLRPSEGAEKSLRLAGVAHLFEIYDVKETALQAFGSPSVTATGVPLNQRPGDDEVLRRQALIQEYTIYMLTIMLQKKSVISAEEIREGCGHAERILSAIRDRLVGADHRERPGWLCE